MIIPELPIFVINLESAVDRRDYICRHLDELGLKYSLSTAIDGNKLSESDLHTVYDFSLSKLHLEREMTRGEVGCTLSHQKLWHEVLNRKLPYALILEDDALLTEDTISVLKRLRDFPEHWEIMLLHTMSGRSQPFLRKPIFKSYYTEMVVELTWKASSYLITSSGAAKLLKLTEPLYLPADWITGDPERNKAWVYAIKPDCAHVHEKYSVLSSLELEREMLQAPLLEHAQEARNIYAPITAVLPASLKAMLRKLCYFVTDSFLYIKKSLFETI